MLWPRTFVTIWRRRVATPVVDGRLFAARKTQSVDGADKNDRFETRAADVPWPVFRPRESSTACGRRPGHHGLTPGTHSGRQWPDRKPSDTSAVEVDAPCTSATVARKPAVISTTSVHTRGILTWRRG